MSRIPFILLGLVIAASMQHAAFAISISIEEPIPVDNGAEEPVKFGGEVTDKLGNNIDPNQRVTAQLIGPDGIIRDEATNIQITKSVPRGYSHAFIMKPDYPHGRYTITVSDGGTGEAHFIYEGPLGKGPTDDPCEHCPKGLLVRGYEMDDGAIHIRSNQDIIKLIPALLRFPDDYQKAKSFINRHCQSISYDEDDGQEKIPGFVIAEVYCLKRSLNEALIDRKLVEIWTEFCPTSEFTGSVWANEECSEFKKQQVVVENKTETTFSCEPGTRLLRGNCIPIGPYRCTPETCESGKITKVVDGDTVDINGARIRLSLVNTPERNERGYQEAKEFTEEFCPPGASAELDPDELQGRSYGRIVGEVYCNGQSLNGALIYSRNAEILTTFCTRSEFSDTDWAAACRGEEPPFETPVINPQRPAPDPPAFVIPDPGIDLPDLPIPDIVVDPEIVLPQNDSSIDITTYEEFQGNPFDPAVIDPTPIQLLLIGVTVFIIIIVAKFRKK